MIVDSIPTMDTPRMSFTANFRSLSPPQSQSCSKYGSDGLQVDQCVMPVRSQVCYTCGQTFLEEKHLLLHLQLCRRDGTSPKATLAPPRAPASRATVRPARTPAATSSIASSQSTTIGPSFQSKTTTAPLPPPPQPPPPPSHLNNFHGHCTRNQQRMFKAFARSKARKRAQESASQFDPSRPVSAHWAKVARRSRAAPERHPSECRSQEEQLRLVGLVTNSKARRIKRQSESHDVDVDCQIVAVEGPLSGAECFHSPRTTRSLMSQLSRESAELARRRLSFCQENEDASESEIFDGCMARRTTQTSLLAIDFSSPLGQRLKKHMKSDLVVPPLADVEAHCCRLVLDEITAKLRHRTSDYPIMHRKRKGIVAGYCHTFKFNGSDRREFIRTLRTGLNERSRKLLSVMKKCWVSLKRLRPEIIRQWTVKRMTIINQEIPIDDDISIVQVDVPEHFFNQMQKMPVPSSQHSGHAVYQECRPEAQYQTSRSAGHPVGRAHSSYPFSSPPVRGSGQAPVPQFLVKQVNKSWTESGQESQKLVFVPLEEAGSSQHHGMHLPNRSSSRSLLPASSQRPATGIQQSLPRHLRPCPKSRRRQRDELTIHPASSFSRDEANSSSRCRGREDMMTLPQSGDYSTPVSKAGNSFSGSSYVIRDILGHHSLQVATTDTTRAESREPVASDLRTNPGARVPPHFMTRDMPATAQRHFSSPPSQEQSLALDLSLTDSQSELRKQLSVFNLTPNKAPGGKSGQAGDRRTADSRSGCALPDGAPDNFLQLNIDAVYGAEELSDERLAASLGLDSMQSSAPPPPATAPRSSRSLLRPLVNHSAQHRQSSPALQRMAGAGVSQQPAPPCRRHPAHRGPSSAPPSASEGPRQSSGGHQPAILRGARKQQGPVAGASPSPRDPLAKRVEGPRPVAGKVSSALKGWTPVRKDEDVVEVICIDDDD